MESWVYGSEGKAFMISDETLTCSNEFVRAKEALNGWDLKNTFHYWNPVLIPSPELIENKGISELRFCASLKGTSVDRPMGVSVSSNVSDGRTAKTPFQKQESGSKDSSSITDINGEDTSFIDLKLGRLVDFKNSEDNQCPRDTRSSFSVTSTVPAKKIRSTCLNAQTPFCQVYGCNIDLSSSKDYHKRHKVCEIHSKTAKVIVNGIEQRFCQQCSRFHLLAEFDEGKRSCRKRLAGHNERRRKPQPDIHCRSAKLVHSYHGHGFLDTSMPVGTSFLCPDIFPSGILHEVKYINGDWNRNAKVVDEISSNGQPPMSAATGQFFPKAFLPCHNTEKQFPSMYDVGNQQFPSMYDVGNPSGDISYKHRNQVQHGSAGSYLFLNSGSNVQDFSGVTVACCAPSLLSSQLPSASAYSAATPMAQPLVPQCGQAPHSVTQFSDMPLPVVAHTSTGRASNRFSSSGMNSPEDEEMNLLVSSASKTVDFKDETNVTYQGSQLFAKELLSPEHGNTVNMLQLSSLLQSAEEQRLLQAERECEVFSFAPITEVE